jgi:hypothetical protein
MRPRMRLVADAEAPQQWASKMKAIPGRRLHMGLSRSLTDHACGAS